MPPPGYFQAAFAPEYFSFTVSTSPLSFTTNPPTPTRKSEITANVNKWTLVKVVFSEAVNLSVMQKKIDLKTVYTRESLNSTSLNSSHARISLSRCFNKVRVAQKKHYSRPWQYIAAESFGAAILPIFNLLSYNRYAWYKYAIFYYLQPKFTQPLNVILPKYWLA